MTYTIYADEVLVLNTVIHYFLLLSAMLLARVEIHRLRIFFAAAAASVYSLLALLPSLRFFYTLPMRGVFLLLFTVIAAGFSRKTLFASLLFLLLTLLFGGAVAAAVFLTEGASPLRLARGAYLPVSLRAAAAISSLLWYLTARLLREVVPARRRSVVEAEVTLRGKSARLKLLSDTGSVLRDPLTNRMTPVVDPAALEGIFSGEEKRILREKAPDEAMLALGGSGVSFRLFPVRTAAGEDMLLAFLADKVVLGGKEKKGLAVALAKGGFLPSDGFDGVVGCE